VDRRAKALPALVEKARSIMTRYDARYLRISARLHPSIKLFSPGAIGCKARSIETALNVQSSRRWIYSDISAMARPRTVDRPRHHARPDRVVVNVRQYCRDSTRFDNLTVRSACEDRTEPAAATIQPLRHSNVQRFRPRGERHLPCLGENVHMTTHERIAEQLPIGSSKRRSKPREVLLAFLVSRQQP
jgi:hypothetical protein